MRRFRAILAVEPYETQEGMVVRSFHAGAFSWRALPLTLRGTVEDNGGHAGAFPLGRLDLIERQGGWIVAAGILDDEGTGSDADRRRDVIRQIELGIVNGISVDPGGVEVTEECSQFDEDGWCEQVRVTFHSYVIAAATLVATPAIEGTLIELLADEEEDAPEMASAEDALDAIAASAAPDVAPRAFFDDPELTELTRVPVVTEDGRVFGHLEGWGDCHLNFADYCQTPWRSPTGYAYFHVCAVETDEGPLAVGPLAVSGGHFPSVGDMARDWRSAQAHYDDPETCVAYVRVGEDEHGKWFSGVLRQGVTAEQVAAFRSHPLSTDHRRIGGAMELVGANSVNVPGFVREVALVASAAGVMEPIAAVVSPPRCEECGGDHETPAHPVEAVAASADPGRLTGDLATILRTMEPEARNRLRERIRAHA